MRINLISKLSIRHLVNRCLKTLVSLSIAWLPIGPAHAVNPEAMKSMMGNATGAGANAIVARKLFQECKKKEGGKRNWEACAMAMMSVAQGLSQVAGALGSMKTAKDASGNIPDSDFATLAPNEFKALKENEASMQLIKNDLERNGYALGPDGQTLKTPLGNLNAKALSSKQAALAAGLSPDSAAKIEANNQFAEQVAKQHMAAFDGTQGSGKYGADGGGEGGGGYNYLKPGHGGYNTDKSNLGSGLKTRAASAVSGLTRTYGGEKVGVAADNIFSLVSRQYEKKSHARHFLD